MPGEASSARRRARRGDPPAEVAAIRKEIEKVLSIADASGRVVSNAQWGVYAFYDYDGEPIYAGKTHERLRSRIGRHLTNQRTDAVAMSVLDPFEVCDIEMWPFFELDGLGGRSRDALMTLEAAEYTVYQKVLAASALGAVLNEKDVPVTVVIDLPSSVRARIIPEQLYELRKHADVRIARRASTIASLARVISEREVSPGLRRTLLTQARRLERLARVRLREIGGGQPVEGPDEETD